MRRRPAPRSTSCRHGNRPGRAGARDIVQLTTVLVDLDHGDIEAKRAHLVDHLGAPSLEVASGGITDEGQAKRHLYWRLTEPAESEDLALVCRLRGAIAEKVCGDPAFGSAHQPVRVAGSVYGKQGSCRPVRILEHSMREVELAELAEAVLAMPVMPGCRDGAATTAGLGPKAAELLTRRIREGGLDEVTRFEAVSGSSGTGSGGRVRVAAVSKGLGTRSPTTISPELRHPFRRRSSPRVRAAAPLATSTITAPGRRTCRRTLETRSADQTSKLMPPEASEDALAERFRGRHGGVGATLRCGVAGSAGTAGAGAGTRPAASSISCRLLCREAAAGRDKAAEARRLASLKTIAAVERIARSDPALAARADADPIRWC